MHAYSNMLQAPWIIYNAYNKNCGACMIIYKWDGDLKLFEFLKNIVTLCNKKQWTQSLKNETNKYVPLPVHCRRHLIVSVIKVHPIVYIIIILLWGNLITQANACDTCIWQYNFTVVDHCRVQKWWTRECFVSQESIYWVIFCFLQLKRMTNEMV